VPSLIPYCPAPFGALILPSLLKDKSSWVPKCQNMWIFGRLALHKVQLMKWKWSRMLKLGGYLITFVKMLTPSKCHSFGGVLAIKQLEIQLLWGFIVDCYCWCWSRRPNSMPLLWVKEHEPFNCVHPIYRS
jgi:hypothetical protein